MKVSVAPQANATLEGTLFELPEEYDPLIPLGADRAFYHHLKNEFESRGHTIGTIDQINASEADILFFIGLRGGFKHYHKALEAESRPFLAFFAREPPAYTPQHAEKTLTKLTRHFDVVLTWMDSLDSISQVETFELPISPRQLSMNPCSDAPEFDERTLLTNISSKTASAHPEELYSERRRLIEFYERAHPSDFTLYGKGWSDPVMPADICYELWQDTNYDVYEGLIESKQRGYANHKFVLAFENMTGIRAYVSEKVFDAFAAGRVPIYWGASNIDEYLPDDTYIDYREFGHPDCLHDFLTSMTESEYHAYISAIDEFLQSGSDRFRADSIAEDVVERLCELSDGDLTSLREPTFIRQLEREYRSDDITYARTIGTAVEAMIDPPDGLLRTKILKKTFRAGYNQFSR